MNTIIESLFSRKSCRAFTGQHVSPEDKRLLFEAAFQAPTAGNQMMYTIIDVTDQAVKDELAELCDQQPFIREAPAVFVFLADCARWMGMYRAAGISPRSPEGGDLMIAVADAIIAAQNVVVAAESLGLGSCYIGDILENRERVRGLLNMPGEVFPAAMLVIGYPAEHAIARRKPGRFTAETVVCENRYVIPSVDACREAYCAHEGITQDNEAEFVRRMKAFHARKYASGFMEEMNRSAGEYLNEFIKP